MLLQRRHQRVADLVIGDDALFDIRQNGPLLLRPGDDRLEGDKQVLLRHGLAALADGPQCRLVDEVRQGRTDSPRCRLGDLVEIDILGQLDISGVDPEGLVPAIEIGPVDDDAAVKSTGAQQRLVQNFGPVRCRQDDDALAGIEPVDLRWHRRRRTSQQSPTRR